MKSQSKTEQAARKRIAEDPQLAPHAATLLHDCLMTTKHVRFLSTHHRSQLIKLAETLGGLGLLR